MADSEVEVSPVWIRSDQTTRDRVVDAIERDAWRPEIERRKAEPSLGDERMWCDMKIFEKMVEMKRKVNLEMREMDQDQIDDIRRRSNPHEPLLSNKIMFGRYSVLMASIDRVTNLLLTNENVEDAVTKRPLDTRPRGKNIDRESEMFYFAESQTLPVPFASQYIWLRKAFYNAKCFSPQLAPMAPLCALTSRAFLDTVKRVSYEQNYHREEICIPYEPGTREAFVDLVMRGTRGEGVHLYAGFNQNITPYREKYGDGEGQAMEGITDSAKELLFRDSYLGQLLYAATIVRRGGKAMLHMLDTNTSYSVAVIYLAHIMFDRISIYKPNMSRPANSERFVICDGLRQRESRAIRRFIETILEKVRANEFLVRLFPDRIIDEDENFKQYVQEANNLLMERQHRFLESYHRMMNDEERENTHQKKCLETCLPYYLIPFATQDEMKNLAVELKGRSGADILGEWIGEWTSVEQFIASLSHKRTPFHPRDFNETNKPLMFTKCAETTPTFIVVTNYGIEFWSTQRREWIIMTKYTTTLPPETILMGDVIETPGGRTLILRILDAGVIFGDDISALPLRKRLQAAEKLVEAVRKDGARQEVIVTVARYEDMNERWRDGDCDRVVEDEIYFMRKTTRIVKADSSFYSLCAGENLWEG